MTDYRLIEMHIRRARLQRSIVMGELIAGGIFALWSGVKRLANFVSTKVDRLVKTRDAYLTGLPNP